MSKNDEERHPWPDESPPSKGGELGRLVFDWPATKLRVAAIITRAGWLVELADGSEPSPAEAAELRKITDHFNGRFVRNMKDGSGPSFGPAWGRPGGAYLTLARKVFGGEIVAPEYDQELPPGAVH